MALEDKINRGTILSYASACVEVARTCARLGAEGYRHSVIPSRGAAPIEHGALSYFHTVVKSAIGPENQISALWKHIESPLGSSLYLPFTANSCAEMDSIESSQIRTFWVKVLAAILRGDLDDPHYRFFTYTRDTICRVGFKSTLEDKIRSNKFVFLDTVVSGRAIIEILDAFQAEGLDECHYILVVDENGAKLQPEYQRRLNRLSAEGRATLLYVDSLFTEDQGPAVSGIWCLSCPELMSIARDEVSSFADGAIGAGVYYHEISRRDDGSNEAVTVGIAQLDHLVWRAVQIVTNPDTLKEDLTATGHLSNEFSRDKMLAKAEYMSEDFDELTARYLDCIIQNQLFDKAITRAVAIPRLLKIAAGTPRVEVSSSHALRLHFSRDEAARLVREFRRTLPAGC